MALDIDLTGKRALITGSTQGIGLGITRMLARAGCSIVGCGLSAEDSDNAANFRMALGDRPGRYHFCDVSRPEEVARIAEAAVAELGGLDIVVSNAGRNIFRGTSDCSDAEWQRNSDLNLASHWRLARATRDALTSGPEPGCFIVITSNQAFQTIPGCFPYNVTKTALTGLVRALAIEWGPGARCVGVAPGFIETTSNCDWFDSFDDPAAERARTEASHPVGRIGTPDEVGALCAFLASPMASFINGTTILQDGGRCALLQDGAPYIHPSSAGRPSGDS